MSKQGTILVVGKMNKYQQTLIEIYSSAGYEIVYQEHIPRTPADRDFTILSYDDVSALNKFEHGWYRKYEKRGVCK